ncbi:potassium transporter Kup [Roseibium sp. RKSG952]|uniref:potassium transporter Kup n=1 Tax=Roseibium sp. RKSG952 TaxID=2529384 RepID=UPI0012BBDEE7|nr:potassium transporter Kup [Roseibium sp. RKSG952]MTH96051.1 potassium transporter Kup [Roseibium sp. RKSG952]
MGGGSVLARSGTHDQTDEAGKPATFWLSISALGIVYGDIGTSPIYALREAIKITSGDAAPSPADIIGALSMVFWALTLVVAIKYALIVLRADNNGEGGTLSIMTLARSAARKRPGLCMVIGMIGASLFFGDAVITPAISVLSAVEGLEVSAPGIAEYIVPITIVILVSLFAVQRFGTGRVSIIFGPFMLLWFAVLGVTGITHLADDPTVLRGLNPLEAGAFMVRHWEIALPMIGLAFLAVTGAEALYVDLGHFGRKPILLAWFGLVFPCLVLNYFGQGAFLLGSGDQVTQPIFEMVRAELRLPMVLLATVATVIASQAVISGAFSLTRQAIQLHLLPRFTWFHTSVSQPGQIYVPQVNWLVMAGVLLLVVGFGSSEAIAAAYGLSVTGEMVVTTVLLSVVMRGKWMWSGLAVAAVIGPLLLVDLTFLTANAMKVRDGGWVSLLIASFVLLVMWTWTRGRTLTKDKTGRAELPLETVIRSLKKSPPQTVPGTAIFLTGDYENAPTSLMHSLKHYKVLHERNFVLMVKTLPRPRVDRDDRVIIDPIDDTFTRLTLNFGYMEDPDVPKALASAKRQGLVFDMMSTSFFVSRRSLRARRGDRLPLWQKRLFIALAKNGDDTTAFFHLPAGRVVEIGAQVVI